MDAFYASVEQRDDPSLRGRPVAVGGSPQGRGVVAASSYEARKFGVRSAMPMARAVRLCPDLLIVRPDFARYRAASQKVMAILRECTPLVEPLSLDEAYLDVTDNLWGEPLATVVARKLKSMILEQTNLTASAGVAPNKFLAKLASDLKKPDGFVVITEQDKQEILDPLGVVTTPFPAYVQPSRSPTWFSGNMTSAQNLPASSSTASMVSTSRSACWGSSFS